MAQLKLNAKVTRFFKTPIYLSDNQIVDWLRVLGIKLIPHGPGGFPTENVFHTPYDDSCIWRGSRLDSNVLAFYAESDDDPLFTALLKFSEELVGEKKDDIIATATTALPQPKTA